MAMRLHEPMDIDTFIRRSKLPSLPAVSVRLMEMMARENISFPALGKLLMTDASLATEVLRAANSPLFGTRAEVKSIPHALATLGFNRVSILVVTTSLWRSIPGSISRQLVRAWWRHNLATALLAKHLEGGDDQVQEAGYTAGLLHSVGQLALLGAYPTEYHTLLTRAANEGLLVSSCEKETFGVDHCELGAALLTQWHVPADIAEGARYHHDPDAAEQRSTQLVSIGCETANFFGYSVFSHLHREIQDLSEPARELATDDLLRVMIEEKVNALESSLL
jgi:HD-like signal output (HDOD) protein